MAHKITFEEWKQSLRADCIAQEKLTEFNNLGDYTLRLLYESGTGPSVAAIVRDGTDQQSPQS